MIYYSQRDNRWRRKKLGFSNLTIGSHGCTITCLAMVSGLTPDEVNERLKRNNGFAQKNLVIWKKTTCLGLEFIWRGWKYENEKVKEAIKKYGFCLVNVLAGKVKHWVVFIGNQRMVDPWDGKEKPTSTYKKLLGYCIVKKTSEVPCKCKRELEECLKAHSKLMSELEKKDKELKLAQATIDANAKVINELEEKRERLEEVKEDYRRKYEKEKAERESYDNFIKRLAERLKCPAKMQDIEGEVQELVEKEDGEDKAKRELEAFRNKVNEFFEKLGDILYTPPQEKSILEALQGLVRYKNELEETEKRKDEEISQLEKLIEEYKLRKEVKKVKESRGKKVIKVILWAGIPYAVLKVVEILSGMEGFAEYSPILNIIAYVAKQVLTKP